MPVLLDFNDHGVHQAEKRAHVVGFTTQGDVAVVPVNGQEGVQHRLGPGGHIGMILGLAVMALGTGLGHVAHAEHTNVHRAMTGHAVGRRLVLPFFPQHPEMLALAVMVINAVVAFGAGAGDVLVIGRTGHPFRAHGLAGVGAALGFRLGVAPMAIRAGDALLAVG